MTDSIPREPSGLELQLKMSDRLIALLPPDVVERRLRAELARRERETECR